MLPSELVFSQLVSELNTLNGFKSHSYPNREPGLPFILHWLERTPDR